MTRLVVNNSLARRAFSRSITVAPGAQEMPIPQQSLTEIADSLQSMADQMSAMKNDQSSTVQTIKDIQTFDTRVAKHMIDTAFGSGSIEVTLNDLKYTYDEARKLYTFYLSAEAYNTWATEFAKLFDNHPQGSFESLQTMFENVEYTRNGSVMQLIGSIYPHVSYAMLNDKNEYIDANATSAQYLSIEILHINEGALEHMLAKPQNYDRCVVLSLVLAKKDGKNEWTVPASNLSYEKTVEKTENGLTTKTSYDCLIKRGGVPTTAKSVTADLKDICGSWCTGVADTSAPVKLKYASKLKQ